MAFKLERLCEGDAEHLVYERVKASPSGSVSLMLTPLELLDRLAALSCRRADIGTDTLAWWRSTRCCARW